MAGRPEIMDGYLGIKPEFEEYGLELDSHKNFEFRASPNHFEIKLKAKQPMKVTHKLIDCKTGNDVSEYAFYQQMNQFITFHVHLPEEGFYKCQIYGLPASSDTKAIPNVLNYLINCSRVTSQAYPFPRQFTEWKTGCFLLEPMVLHSKSKLKDIDWHVKVPNAKAIAVVANDEWFYLDHKGGPIWQAKVSLDHLKGKLDKILLRANFTNTEQGREFRTLLEYKI